MSTPHGWSIPPYRYDEKTTLAGLVRELLETNRATSDQLSEKIGSGGSGVSQWLESKFTVGLLTTCRANIEAVTGISVDRLLVINAKKAVGEKFPELKEKIDFAKLVTRAELIEELSVYAETYYDGLPSCIERQVRSGPGMVSQWFARRGGLPSGEYLENIIEALARGLIEGTRDDVMFILLTRKLFGCELADVFPDLGLKGFADAIRAIFKVANSNSPELVRQKSGLPPHHAQAFLKYGTANKKVQTTESTMLAVLAALVKLGVAKRFAITPDARAQLGQLGGVSVVTTTSPAVKATEVSPVVPPAPAPVPIQAPTPVSASPAWLGDERAQMAVHYRALANILDPRPSTPSFEHLLGVAIGGIEDCFSQADLQGFCGVGLSQDQVQSIQDALRNARRMLLLIAGLDPKVRTQIKPMLDRQLNEIWLAAESLAYANPRVAQGLEATINLVRGNGP